MNRWQTLTEELKGYCNIFNLSAYAFPILFSFYMVSVFLRRGTILADVNKFLSMNMYIAHGKSLNKI